MDDSFDMDSHMSDAPRHNRNSQRSNPGNGQRNCHTCGQPGHIQRDCPQNRNQNQNNQNQNQNRNTNGQQGRNGNANGRNGGVRNQNQNGQNRQNQNGNQNRNNTARGNANQQNTDPADVGGVNDDCHRHRGRGHTNGECTSASNVHHPEHRGSGPNNNQQQQQQQQQPAQPKPQANRHGNIRRDHGPLSNAENNYCERCNSRGHIAATCDNQRITATIIKCLWCKNPGHTHLECNHPLCCANCRGKGHSAESCRNIPALETRLSAPPASVFRVHSQPQGFAFQPQHRQISGSTRATFGPDFAAPEPLDELTTELLQLKAQRDAERRHAIDTKCWGSHKMYGHKLLNQDIIEGENFFSRIDPSNPQIHLPKDKTPTNTLTQLFANFITHRPFGVAASLIARGWNFFRDPRALDAIARCQVPTCNGCAKKGEILSATFERVTLGTDVLTVDDWDVWGVSVLFGCHCCRDVGYSFVQGVVDPMEWES
ncbi:hypothetical protein Q7P37_011221 [Cladosporium fusiforme]